MKFSQLILSVTLGLAAAGLSAETTNKLSLTAAEKIAIERDLVLQSQSAQKQAMQEQAVAADNWPDPVFKIGALAVPVDTFDLEQEQMTQVVLGYKQMLPRGDSAEIKSSQFLDKAALSAASQSQRKAMLIRRVRKAWLNVYLKERTRDIINTNTTLFKQLVKVSQSQYVAGRKKQQDVLQAEVELSLVEDQLEKAETELEVARAALAQWLGNEAAQQPLDLDTDFLGKLMLTEQQMSEQMLLKHPSVSQRDAMIQVSEKDVQLAHERAGSQWGFDITYGIRQGDNPAMAGGERADFLSMIAMVSVPVFGDDKNDRMIAASKQQLLVKKYLRQDQLRVLQTQLNQARARWYKTIDRIDRYRSKVLPQAKQNARAAMSAYQSGVGSFIALTRARVSEFKAQLSHLKLNVEKARVLADIRYLVGEE